MDEDEEIFIDIGISNNSDKLSKEKSFVLGATCLSIGMFIGLLGPTFPLLEESISIEISSIVQFISVKAIGFLIGTCLSSYLYIWFNVCCLLGLPCLSISFGVCSLPFLTDLTTFYSISLILGIGLGLSYNGIDALYNRLWAQPSALSIRWLHLLIALGAIFSTLLLISSTISNDNDISMTMNITQAPRLRREILTNLSTNNTSTAIITSISSTTKTTTTTHRNKPPTAISDNDDLSQNLFYLKIRLFFHSITSIHLLYLFLALSFFILGIFYSILAIRGEGTNTLSITNLNPLSLLFIKPHRIINNVNTQISLLSDRPSLKFVFLVLLFYFILSGIESSCTYLTYIYGIEYELSTTKCLLLQFCYLFGRLFDILINYSWFLLNKQQSDYISIKVLILIRLSILLLICFFNIYQQIFYILFFSIGILLTSLSSLILYWIERDLSLNETLTRLILYTTIISEMIIPIVFFYKMKYFLQYYLFISLCLLILLFLIIVYSSKKWQRNRLYRLLPTSMDIDQIELQENSDNDDNNEKSKGLKGH